MSTPDDSYIQWLVDQSMLHAARERSRLYAGQARRWPRPYAQARPRDASAIGAAWLTPYPAAILTPERGTVHEALRDARLSTGPPELRGQGDPHGKSGERRARRRRVTK